MNSLHKSLIIGFLAVSIFISGLPVDLVSAQNKAAGTAATQRSEDLLLSQYLRFGRLTAEDGLSADQTWDLAQDNHGFMWFATAILGSLGWDDWSRFGKVLLKSMERG